MQAQESCSMSARTTWHTMLDTPLGPLCIVGTAEGLTRVEFQHGKRPVQPAAYWMADRGVLDKACHQLQEYFQGQRRDFTLSLAPVGTPFQQRVWQALQQIPYGTTSTYQELAQHLGNPAAARAIGAANGRNPLAIIIPCHRLIGSDGRLRGYAGGITVKQRLLEHESLWFSAAQLS